MSKIVGDTACPSCQANGNDKTGNHLILFEDGGSYCNRCGHKGNWKDDGIKPTERKPVTDSELREILGEFNECETKAYTKRKLKKSTVERYGCKVGCSPSDRTSVGSYLLPYHSYDGKTYSLTGYKVRLVEEKKFWNMGRPKDACLFGQQLLPKGNFKKLYICESAMDTMSVYQAIEDAWKSKGISAKPHVVGLPHGTGCAIDVLNKNKDVIDRASEIILVMDNDIAGKECVDKIASLYPEIKSVTLTEFNDPNDYLVNNKSDELSKLVQFSAVEYKLDGMADISELIEEIAEPPVMGAAYPWKTMTDLTYGIRDQQIIGIAAGVGMGKSDIKNELIVHFCKQGMHVTAFDLEYSYKNTGKLLASKAASKPLHRPDSGVTKEEIKEALEPLSGRLSLYKHKGSRDWDEIKSYIRHSVITNNSKLVMLDPITALVAHLSSSEANDMLNTIFSDLSAMSQELDFTTIYYAHLNPPKTGASHERGGKVNESQMTGSRAMMKWSTHIWGLEGTKDPDLPEHERNVRKMVLLKDREYGNVGSFYLYYDKETTRLLERFS